MTCAFVILALKFTLARSSLTHFGDERWRNLPIPVARCPEAAAENPNDPAVASSSGGRQARGRAEGSRPVFTDVTCYPGNLVGNAHGEPPPTDVPVGGRRCVPAATAADISELFIKSMTSLSKPISGPSFTGVPLLLSGRVSSILLPSYSLELLMANTIPPFLPGLSRLAAWNQA